jgi:hypothetical protein
MSLRSPAIGHDGGASTPRPRSWHTPSRDRAPTTRPPRLASGPRAKLPSRTEHGVEDRLLGHPIGEGVFAFETAGEAAAGIERLLSDPDRHAKAARALADEYFDSSKVLPRLLDAAL